MKNNGSSRQGGNYKQVTLLSANGSWMLGQRCPSPASPDLSGRLELSLSQVTAMGSTMIRTRDGTGQDFLDPTGIFQNHRRLTGF